MIQEFEELLARLVSELFGVAVEIELTRPEESFGDFSTNVALQLAKSVGRSPREIAEELKERLQSALHGRVEEVSVAGPGFLNLRLHNSALLGLAFAGPETTLIQKTVVVEYSDPNPFKPLHAGHLYTTLVGDSIARLFEIGGATVIRINYGGDVGLHVAKAMWAIVRRLENDKRAALESIPSSERAVWLGECYVAGNAAYEDDTTAHQEIVEINKQIYALHEHNDHSSEFAQIYWTCRQWSYDYFQQFYRDIAVHPFDRIIPESEITPKGLSTVREQLAKGVYTESDGAVVFRGEEYGLHTRVFINAQGLPTYEAKDVGLLLTKWQDYHFDLSAIITAQEQAQYMAVMLKSVEQFAPEPAQRSVHLTHGTVKLEGGAKMSSRAGNVVLATDIISAASQANQVATGKDDQVTVLGAIKYAFLKNRIGNDISYDPRESVSLEGNSGPYLQYAHARARSILRKAATAVSTEELTAALPPDLNEQERSLIRAIGQYSEEVERAVSEMMPHHICSYLYDLAQTFNRFYEHNRVIGDERERFRIGVVSLYADTLKKGLAILGIAAPEQM